MAQLHNALTRGNLSEALKGILGATKSEGGIERYGETLTPIVNLWERPEFGQLRDEYPFGFHIAFGAVAAEFSAIGIGCPLSVGNQSYLVVVEDAVCGIGTAGGGWELRTALRATVAATLLNGGSYSRDMRSTQLVPASTLGATPAEGWSGSDPAQIAGVVVDRGLSNTVFELIRPTSLPWILTPGRVIVFNGDVVNQSMRATFKGYIRVANRGELVQ